MYRHFRREAKIGCLYHDIQEPGRRTRKALGVDRRSFRRWIQQDGDCTEAAVKQGRKKKIDDFDKDVIRRLILKMFNANQLVTLRMLKSRLQAECDINVSKTTLWQLVRSVGFTFRKTSGGKEFFM